MEPQFAETGHVLFVDLVGFSKLPVERQASLVQELAAIVRSTEAFRRAEAEGELFTLPTGDGMALVFFRYPLAPLHCAREIAAAARGGGLSLRMGVHVGAVTRVTDAAGRINLNGDGLNQAQRVMDCGDSGHILVSAAAADTFKRFAVFSDSLFDLGDFVVKHGERLRIFNFVADGVGLPTPPSRFRAADDIAQVPTESVGSRGTVALIYEPTAPPPQRLIEFLNRELSRSDYTLLRNPQTTVGVEWAQELRRLLTQASVVIALISEAAVRSELFETQIVSALEAQQHRNGLPLIVPIRVEYPGPLPETLHPLLGRLFSVAWDGAALDHEAANALQKALCGAALLEQPIEAIGGAVPLDSRYYIVRPTDSKFLTSVTRRDSIVLVKGARQMGKTSLLTRGLQQAREAGARCFRTDFQKLTSSDLRNEGEFFLSLAEMIAEQMELEAEPEEVWNHRRGGAHNFERFMRRHVLSAPIAHVWALDEVDRLFACPFGTDVFALFRSWHNDRAYEPGGPWSRLTMAIAYATEAHLFITDVNQSPFNVGTRLTLEDFTLSELGELNQRYGTPLRQESALQRFHSLVGGQPYLSRRGLDHLAQSSDANAELEASADQDEGIFGDHLRRLLITVTQDQETLQAVRDILAGKTSLPPNVFYRLRSGGLIVGPSHQEFALRCKLYDSYLRRHLMDTASPS